VTCFGHIRPSLGNCYLTESTALYQFICQYITCSYCMSSLFENVCPHYTHATFILLHPRCVPVHTTLTLLSYCCIRAVFLSTLRSRCFHIVASTLCSCPHYAHATFILLHPRCVPVHTTLTLLSYCCIRAVFLSTLHSRYFHIAASTLCSFCA
jgi:hypothetical protein